jgi:2-amino-4-hydroxy-6-hydroxymethyldihydropteridine diphosphokinase
MDYGSTSRALQHAGCSWYLIVVAALYERRKNAAVIDRRYRRTQMRAGIALGSNLGNRRDHLRSGREKVLQIPHSHAPFFFSALYETDPIGCEPDARKFLNAVMEIGYESEPEKLLSELRRIEKSLGREPDHARNVSRTVDLDLLYFGDGTIDRAELQLPHPRLHLRRFVLAPLADIRPALVLPGQTEPVQSLLKNLADDSAVVCVADEW